MKRTITVVSSKKFMFDGRSFFSDGGFGKVIEGIAKHFDKVVLAVPVKTMIRCHGYVIQSENVKYERLPYYKNEWQFIWKLPVIWLTLIAICRAEKQLLHLWLPGYESVIAYFYREGKRVITYVGGDWGWISKFWKLSSWKTLSSLYSWFNHRLTRLLCDNTCSFLVGDDLYSKYKREVYKTSTSTLLQEDIVKAREVCQHNPIRLLYVGRLSKEKAVKSAVQAVEQLNFMGIKSKLTLVGEGDKTGLDSKYVTMLGYVPQGKPLQEVYDTHDIFVFPSYENSIAKVVLEAMARGMPIVCSDRGAAPEQCSYVKVSPNNASAIVDGVRKIRRNVHFRQKMIKANLESVRSFCIDSIIEQRLRQAEVLT